MGVGFGLISTQVVDQRVMTLPPQAESATTIAAIPAATMAARRTAGILPVAAILTPCTVTLSLHHCSGHPWADDSPGAVARQRWDMDPRRRRALAIRRRDTDNRRMALLELESIRKTYFTGDIALEVLKGISFSVEKGEMVSIMGQSGSGKSTLMNIIGLLDKPTGGIYRIQGRSVDSLGANDMARIRNRSIGFVFQSYHLLKKVTAVENVGLPLFYRQMPRREMLARAEAALEQVDMAERAHHKPSEMSGGQAQRVAIARAIVGQPELLLADEPTGALDTRVGDEILALFKRLNREQGLTVVIITHDPSVAEACDRRLVVRDGLLVADEGEFAHRAAATATG